MTAPHAADLADRIDGRAALAEVSWEGARRAGPARLLAGLRNRAPISTLRSASLGRLGALEVRLATSAKEIRRAQRLRHKVFYEEMAAASGALAALTRRDADAYDEICEHILVLDHAAPVKPFRPHRPKVVGTYRLLRQSVAERHGGFYSAGEYDIDPLLAAHPDKRFLELGRSCVLKPYRSRRTVELLWQGIWAYVQRQGVDVMMGCASFEGTDLDRLAAPLSFLQHHAAARGAWRVRALPERHVPMGLVDPAALDAKAALGALPPLVKAYLRLGATFGDGAVIDRQFGTTDVFVVLPVSQISSRYIEYFGPSANRYAA